MFLSPINLKTFHSLLITRCTQAKFERGFSTKLRSSRTLTGSLQTVTTAMLLSFPRMISTLTLMLAQYI